MGTMPATVRNVSVWVGATICAMAIAAFTSYTIGGLLGVILGGTFAGFFLLIVFFFVGIISQRAGKGN